MELNKAAGISIRNFLGSSSSQKKPTEMQGDNKKSTSSKVTSKDYDVSPGYGIPFWLESKAYHMLDKTECLNFMSKYEGCSNYVDLDTSGDLPRCRCCHEDRGNEFFTSPAVVG